jgi:hypothetical protein
MVDPKPTKLNAQTTVEVRKLASLARYLHNQGYQVNELAKILGACFDKVYSSLKLEEFKSDTEAYAYLIDSGFSLKSNRQQRAIVKGLQAESLADNQQFNLPAVTVKFYNSDEILLEAEAKLKKILDSGGSPTELEQLLEVARKGEKE